MRKIIIAIVAALAMLIPVAAPAQAAPQPQRPFLCTYFASPPAWASATHPFVITTAHLNCSMGFTGRARLSIQRQRPILRTWKTTDTRGWQFISANNLVNHYAISLTKFCLGSRTYNYRAKFQISVTTPVGVGRVGYENSSAVSLRCS